VALNDLIGSASIPNGSRMAIRCQGLENDTSPPWMKRFQSRFKAGLLRNGSSARLPGAGEAAPDPWEGCTPDGRPAPVDLARGGLS